VRGAGQQGPRLPYKGDEQQKQKTVMEQTNEKTTDLQAALGGKTISVQTVKGETKAIFVKALSVRQSDTALSLLNNEWGMAQLYTELLPSDLEALTPDSFNSLIETGEEINASFFDYCLKRARRQAALQERLMPGTRERLMEKAEKVMLENAKK
jgi:hypothetical protein